MCEVTKFACSPYEYFPVIIHREGTDIRFIRDLYHPPCNAIIFQDPLVISEIHHAPLVLHDRPVLRKRLVFFSRIIVERIKPLFTDQDLIFFFILAKKKVRKEKQNSKEGKKIFSAGEMHGGKYRKVDLLQGEI